MYINSPGGIVYSGLAIYDTMHFIKPDVATTCCGIAMSMGSLLLAGGTPGKRSALPNSRILLHQPHGGYQGQATDIAIHAEEAVELRRRMEEIYAEHTGPPHEEVSDVLERDRFFTPEEAKEYGLIDRVVNGRGSERLLLVFLLVERLGGQFLAADAEQLDVEVVAPVVVGREQREAVLDRARTGRRPGRRALR